MTDVGDPTRGKPEDFGGTPVGRRIVLSLLGLAGVGVMFGSKVNSTLAAISENDPTGLTGFIPGGGRFRFYSVAGRVSEIPPAQYRLRISGSVRKPATLTMADLSSLPQSELVRDVQCVTGWRVPQVSWGGVLLSDVLAHVGAAPGAGAVLFGSADGQYTESLTMEQALRPDVMIATSMDGQPVSNNHGGPVRLYVAPMYFYKSLKWLDSITVADQVEPGYWERLGYDVDAWVGNSNGRSDSPTA
jgi:DMSO/TMAO reductase YedYZ molybdopterin-dependent catalytic subunit